MTQSCAMNNIHQMFHEKKTKDFETAEANRCKR